MTAARIPVRSPLQVVLAAAVAVAAGGILVFQVRVNGELAERLDDPVLAALATFIVGAGSCALGLLVSARGRQGMRRMREAIVEGRMPSWYLLGGVPGVLLVFLQGLASPALGVALFTIAIVGGSMIGSLLVDRHGMGRMGPKPLTPSRLVGTLLAIGAVGWAVSDRIQGDVPWWLLVLPFVSGIAGAWQQGVNGQLREESGSALSSTFVIFVVGLIVFVPFVIVHLAISGLPRSFPPEPWLYGGGLVGVAVVAISAVVVRFTGVLVYTLGSIAGQLAMAVVLDLVVPTAGANITVATLGGAVLAIAAVGVTTIRRRRVTTTTGASSR